MRDVVPPQVELVADALLGEQRRRGAWCDSSEPVVSSHWPWPQTSSRLSRDAQPVEVVAAEVRDVVDRVVEVGRLAALAPAVPGGRVVVARHADREREQVGALEREVDGVEGAEADAERDDLAAPALSSWMNGTTWSRIHDS